MTSTLDIEPKLKIFHKPTSKKLFALADVVEEVEQQGNLNMNMWASSFDLVPEQLIEPGCGFAACALGTGAVCFEGLDLTHDDNDHVLIYHGDNDAFEAGMSFFGITFAESYKLFRMNDGSNNDEWKDRSNAQVVANIRTLAQKYQENGL